MAIPEEYGGGGIDDFRFNQVLGEQVAAAAVGAGRARHQPAQRHLPAVLLGLSAPTSRSSAGCPGIASGELITAVAMTEPGAGSDLAGIRTSAKRDGDHYVVNGSQDVHHQRHQRRPGDYRGTDRRTGDDRRSGLSLLILERGMPGFERGRNLDKLGLHSQDTAELSFSDVRVPVENLLGEEGAGFAQLTTKLPQERMSIAVSGGRRGARRVRRDTALRQGAQGVRHHARLVPEHQVRPRRTGHRDRDRADLRRPVRRPAQRGRPVTRRRGEGQVVVLPSCRAARSTSACSCTAVTAT